MRSDIEFRELRHLLIGLGFREYVDPKHIVFRHAPTDTLLAFRPYKPGDRVASYNIIDVMLSLDGRGLMSAESFEHQFRKAPA